VEQAAAQEQAAAERAAARAAAKEQAAVERAAAKERAAEEQAAAKEQAATERAAAKAAAKEQAAAERAAAKERAAEERAAAKVQAAKEQAAAEEAARHEAAREEAAYECERPQEQPWVIALREQREQNGVVEQDGVAQCVDRGLSAADEHEARMGKYIRPMVPSLRTVIADPNWIGREEQWRGLDRQQLLKQRGWVRHLRLSPAEASTGASAVRSSVSNSLTLAIERAERALAKYHADCRAMAQKHS
jgi:flagellar biosynthesis GTPase FlhF